MIDYSGATVNFSLPGSAPASWEAAPPQVPIEIWRYARRNDLVNIMVQLLRLENSQELDAAIYGDRDDVDERVEKAGKTALAVLKFADNAVPRQ